jgi:hypothetical protein
MVARCGAHDGPQNLKQASQTCKIVNVAYASWGEGPRGLLNVDEEVARIFRKDADRDKHMARQKKQPVFAPPGWRQAIKSKFLRNAFHFNPQALSLLATKVRAREITEQDWAASFGVAGTWIEEWAKDTLQSWREQPSYCPAPDDAGKRWVFFATPRDGETEADVFSFEISAKPLCRLSFGVTIGGYLQDGEPEDDWERFKRQMHESLDNALKAFRMKAVQSGSSREIIVPSDLDLKLELAALYLFSNKSPTELAENAAVARDRTVVYRWLKEILTLLELPMKMAGHQPRRSPLH